MEQLILFLVFGIIMMIIASSKGFDPLRWLLAAGLLGLIIIFFLPSAKETGIDDAEKQKRIRRANSIGGIISVFAIILIIIFLIMWAEASSDPEEIRNIFLFSLIPASAVIIGIVILMKRKKIKWAAKLFFGNFLAGAAAGVLLCVIEFGMLESIVKPSDVGVDLFDKIMWVIVSLMYLQFIAVSYLFGLIIWNKAIEKKKDEITAAQQTQ